MKLPALLISDLHLVDAPSCDYRWGLFPWLAEQIKDERVKTLICLGDVTDAKDNHSSALVNRIVSAFDALPVERIVILAGNHDWLKQGHAFFRFLNVLPNVLFVDRVTEDPENLTADAKQPTALYLPYSKTPAKDWGEMDLSHYSYVFMHQTLKGSIASNGQRMEGEDLPDFKNAGARIFSGDIHVPQDIGGITYVGSPYHVHFGDAFVPRCILIDRDGAEHDLHFETISRVVVRVKSIAELRGMRFRQGDQVKLRVELGPEEAHAWARIRREATKILEDKGAIVHGVELVQAGERQRLAEPERQRAAISPGESVVRFVNREELGGDALEAALDIIGEPK